MRTGTCFESCCEGCQLLAQSGRGCDICFVGDGMVLCRSITCTRVFQDQYWLCEYDYMSQEVVLPAHLNGSLGYFSLE